VYGDRIFMKSKNKAVSKCSFGVRST
jgi:hypothetical protein